MALYGLANAVAVWNGTGAGFLNALAIGAGAQWRGVVLLILPAILGGVPACISMCLWLVRRKKRYDGACASTGVSHAEAPGEGHFALSEQYFWKTVLLGPVILSLPLYLLVGMFSAGPGTGFIGLLWGILRLYYGGTVAAALCAAGVLAFARFAESRFAIYFLSICVGVHTGAIFLAIFAPVDADEGVHSFLLGGVLGALSAWICTALLVSHRTGCERLAGCAQALR